MGSKMKSFREKKCRENENEHFIHITITVSAQIANDYVLFRQIPSISQTLAATTWNTCNVLRYTNQLVSHSKISRILEMVYKYLARHCQVCMYQCR